LISPELIAGIQALAVAHDLPEQFVAALGGTEQRLMEEVL
jgi:hypothetical protein